MTEEQGKSLETNVLGAIAKLDERIISMQLAINSLISITGSLIAKTDENTKQIAILTEQMAENTKNTKMNTEQIVILTEQMAENTKNTKMNTEQLVYLTEQMTAIKLAQGTLGS